MTDIDEVEKIADPAERAREIGRRLEALPRFQSQLRVMRQAAVQQMKASGMTYAAIAEAIHLHRNRVQQIAEGRTAGGQGGNSKPDPTPPPPTPKRRRAAKGESV